MEAKIVHRTEFNNLGIREPQRGKWVKFVKQLNLDNAAIIELDGNEEYGMIRSSLHRAAHSLGIPISTSRRWHDDGKTSYLVVMIQSL